MQIHFIITQVQGMWRQGNPLPKETAKNSKKQGVEIIRYFPVWNTIQFFFLRKEPTCTDVEQLPGCIVSEETKTEDKFSSIIELSGRLKKELIKSIYLMRNWEPFGGEWRRAFLRKPAFENQKSWTQGSILSPSALPAPLFMGFSRPVIQRALHESLQQAP